MNAKCRVAQFAIVAIAALVAIVTLAKAFGTNPSTDILTNTERQWLNQNAPHIVLAIEQNYAPFIFANDNGQPQGLAHEYISLVEEKLGVHFQQRRFSNLDDIFNAVKNGEVHIVNAVTKTPHRSVFLNFTDPFVSIPNVILVRSDRKIPLRENTLSGLKVSLVQSYAVTEYLAKAVPGIKPDLVTNDLTALLNVAFGVSDAAVTDLATASYWMATKGITNLRVNSEVELGIHLAIGSTVQMPMLNTILQKGLNAITHAERDEMNEHWMSPVATNVFLNPQYRIFAIAFAFLVFATLATIAILNQTLRRKVRIQTEHLNRELLERKTVEQRLRTAQHRLELACASVALGIWDWNVPEDMLSWNEQMFLIYGIPRREKPLEYEDWRKSVHPNDTAFASEAIAAALRGERDYKIDFRIVQPSGDLRYIQATGIVLRKPDGSPERMIGANLDVTERRQTEFRLRESEVRLRLSTELGKVAVWEFNFVTNTMERSQNHDALYMLDWQDTWSFETFLNATHPDDREVANRTIQNAAAPNGPNDYSFDFRVVHENKPLRWLNVQGRVVERDASGRAVLVRGCLIDVSDRKLAEEELVRAKQAAEQAYRVKSDFLATMSHELRTPLNPLIGFAELLSEAPNLTTEQREWLNIMLQRGSDLTSLIGEVLDLSKIEAQKLLLNPQNLNLHELVESMVISFLPQANKKGIAILSQLGADIPKQVCADGQRLRQIILNLLGNALKFTSEGTITLSVAVDTTGKTARPVINTEIALLFCVRDTGIGIAPNQQAAVFEWYTQADTSHASEYGGTGLGLHIASGLVKLMNGTIWVESVPKRGSAFFFTAIVDSQSPEISKDTSQ